MHYCIHTHSGEMSDLCEKQTMPLVSAFMRDTHLTKPQDCLEGDGVGFQEHLRLNLWNVHIEETRRCLPAPYTNSVLSRSASSHFPASSPQMSDTMFQLQAKRIRVCGSPLTDISNQKGNAGNAKETTGTTSYEIS